MARAGSGSASRPSCRGDWGTDIRDPRPPPGGTGAAALRPAKSAAENPSGPSFFANGPSAAPGSGSRKQKTAGARGPSRREQAAVDDELRAGDVRRLVRGEEQHRIEIGRASGR